MKIKYKAIKKSGYMIFLDKSLCKYLVIDKFDDYIKNGNLNLSTPNYYWECDSKYATIINSKSDAIKIVNHNWYGVSSIKIIKL